MIMGWMTSHFHSISAFILRIRLLIYVEFVQDAHKSHHIQKGILHDGRSEISGKFLNVLEKNGEDQLARSCEK